MAGEGWNREDFDDYGEEPVAGYLDEDADEEMDPEKRRTWLRWYDEVGE